MNEEQRNNLYTAARALRERQHQHCKWMMCQQESTDRPSRHCAWGMALEAVRPGRWARGPRTGVFAPVDDEGRTRETYAELNEYLEKLFGLNTSHGVEPKEDHEALPPTVIQLSEAGPEHWNRIARWMEAVADGETQPRPARTARKTGGEEE